MSSCQSSQRPLLCVCCAASGVWAQPPAFPGDCGPALGGVQSVLMVWKKPAPVWVSLHGSRFLSGVCSSLAPDRNWLQHPQGISTYSRVKSSVGCRVDLCSIVVLHGLQGDNLHYHCLLHGSRTWRTSLSSYFTDLGVCIVVSLTFSHSSLAAAVQRFLPFLEYGVTEALPTLLMSSGLASSRSTLEPAVTGSVQHGGSYWQLLTEATPAALPLPKPWQVNQMHSPYSCAIMCRNRFAYRNFGFRINAASS